MSDKSVVSLAEFKKRLDAGQVEFLFDLRNRDEFEAWRIEGKREVPTLNIPQVDFVGEEEGYLDRFPRDKEIITVCAHGDSSRYSAELLQEQGFRAMSIEGGMDAWSEFYETRKLSDAPEVHQIYRVAKGCMSHVIISGNSAAIIDPIRHIERIMDIVNKAGARVVAVMDTHLQADHISGGMELTKATGADYYVNPIDAKDATYKYIPLQSCQCIKVGSSELKAIHSPGHTPGSTSFVLDERFLFTGDMIMGTSIGRPDLGGMADQWSELLYSTLFDLYGSMSDSLIVLPTHAASVKEQDASGVVRFTLGQAKLERDLFLIKDKSAFKARIKETLLENPARYAEIRKVNLGILNPDEAGRKELEIGKNLCGMADKK